MDPTTLKGHITQTADLLNDMLEAMKFKNEPLPIDDLHRKLPLLFTSYSSYPYHQGYTQPQQHSQPQLTSNDPYNNDPYNNDYNNDSSDQAWGGKSRRRKTSPKSKSKTSAKKIKSKR